MCSISDCYLVFFFFFNDTATTEIYTLSLHDALPISTCSRSPSGKARCGARATTSSARRSEEHTSELQSRLHLVCRLLLEKKKKTKLRNASETHLLAAQPHCTLTSSPIPKHPIHSPSL